MNHPETVEVYEATIYEDPYNPDVPGTEDWTSPVLLDTTTALFDPGTSTEQYAEGRTIVHTRPTLFFSADTDPPVTEKHRVRFRGLWWRIDGEPARYTPPTGTSKAPVLTIERITG